jgi:hypothetical protein
MDRAGDSDYYKCLVAYIYVYTLYSYNEELQNSFTSPNIIRMIKSRRMRWTGQETQIITNV